MRMARALRFTSCVHAFHSSSFFHLKCCQVNPDNSQLCWFYFFVCTFCLKCLKLSYKCPCVGAGGSTFVGRAEEGTGLPPWKHTGWAGQEVWAGSHRKAPGDLSHGVPKPSGCRQERRYGDLNKAVCTPWVSFRFCSDGFTFWIDYPFLQILAACTTWCLGSQTVWESSRSF